MLQAQSLALVRAHARDNQLMSLSHVDFSLSPTLHTLKINGKKYVWVRIKKHTQKIMITVEKLENVNKKIKPDNSVSTEYC